MNNIDWSTVKGGELFELNTTALSDEEIIKEFEMVSNYNICRKHLILQFNHITGYGNIELIVVLGDNKFSPGYIFVLSRYNDPYEKYLKKIEI